MPPRHDGRAAPRAARANRGAGRARAARGDQVGARARAKAWNAAPQQSEVTSSPRLGPASIIPATRSSAHARTARALRRVKALVSGHQCTQAMFLSLAAPGLPRTTWSAPRSVRLQRRATMRLLRLRSSSGKARSGSHLVAASALSWRLLRFHQHVVGMKRICTSRSTGHPTGVLL